MITLRDFSEAPLGEALAMGRYVEQHLRSADRQEVLASSGMAPTLAVCTSYQLSTHGAFILDADGVPIGAFGAAPHPLPGVGVVWMLGTDGIERNARAIARASRPVKDRLNSAYPLLWNYVDERNRVSIRWLEWAGYRRLSGGHKLTDPDIPFTIFARTALDPQDLHQVRGREAVKRLPEDAAL